MNKHCILLISSLLLLSACSGGEPQVNNSNPTPQPSPVPKPEVENNISSEELTNKNIASTPKNSGVVSGLIASTNPEERLKQVNQGKSDPFTSIRPPKVVKVASKLGLSSSLTKSGRNAIVKETDSASVQDQVAIVKTPPQEVQTSQESSSESLAAREIRISGIVDLQGENVALINTPWDGGTRSVRVGDIISDSSGMVNLEVKEISFRYPTTIALRDENQIIFRDINDSGGIVVLEQNGQLITREVAQQVDNETELEEL